MSLDQELSCQLDAVRGQGLYRQLHRIDSPQSSRIQIDGRPLLNFSSNDYLGLANEPALKEASIRAIERFGTGAGASRLVCGSLSPHHELDETLADFKGAEAALSFSSGYAGALATIGALLSSDDLIVLDKRVHACIVDAARLSGARIRVFHHNDASDLESILRWADKGSPQRPDPGPEPKIGTVGGNRRRRRVLVVTESVFSMDGDQAPLAELVELKDRYGAWLMVDEAHAAGLFGPNRRGLAEAVGVSERIEIQMGTLGKALGAAGGYICGSRALVDLVVNRGRAFIFSTAPVPAAAAAATAGVRFVRSGDGAARCRLLWQRVAEAFVAIFPEASSPSAAILPLIVGDEEKAVVAAKALSDAGLFIPAIRYPTVARGSARLRLTLTAAHTAADISALCSALSGLGLAPRTSSFVPPHHAPHC